MPESRNSVSSLDGRQPEDGDTIEVQEPSIEESEADRHAKAYAEMTKLAAPLPLDAAGPSGRHLDALSKKRHRTDEIATSDASSRYATLSPRRRSNTASEVGRPSGRLATPEENRRESAPSRLGNTTPVQANTPKRRRYGEHDSAPIFKEEKVRRDSSPDWLLSVLEDLRSKHPNDRFSSDKEFVKCLDCDDRVFNMTTKTGKPVTRNLEQHLNGKTHQDRVAARISKESKKDVMMTEPSFCSMFQYAKPSFIEFSGPQPIQCFSLPNLPASPSNSNGEPNLKQLRGMMNQYMDAFENDTSARRVRTTLLEQRQAESERIQEERLEKLKESLTESSESHKRLCSQLEESLTNYKQENGEQAHQMEDMLLDSRQKAMDHASSLEHLEGRFAASDSQNQQHLSQMAEQLNKSDNKYFELMGRFASFEKNSKKKAEDLANKMDTLEGRNQDLVGGALAQLATKLSESDTRQREHSEGLLKQVSSQLSDSEARQNEHFQVITQRVEASQRITQDQIDGLASELVTSKQYTKETLISIMHRLLALEKEPEKQSESINDLESQLQIHADELQRQRDSEEALRQSLIAQVDVRFTQSMKRMQKLEKEISERVQAVESSSNAEFEKLEKETGERIQAVKKDSAARIKELEKVNEEHNERINGYHEIFPLLFSQMNELIETVESLKESVAAQNSRLGSPKPHARQRTAGARPA